MLALGQRVTYFHRKGGEPIRAEVVMVDQLGATLLLEPHRVTSVCEGEPVDGRGGHYCVRDWPPAPETE